MNTLNNTNLLVPKQTVGEREADVLMDFLADKVREKHRQLVTVFTNPAVNTLNTGRPLLKAAIHTR